MTWHLLIFALIGVVVTNDPHEIMVFRTYNAQLLWPIYLGLAAGLPVLLNVLWEQIKNRKLAPP